jgi:multidrug resistance efflux pump
MVRSMTIVGTVLFLVVLVSGGRSSVFGAEPIVLDSVLVTLIDDVAVPARQTAVLEQLLVREGDRVRKGDLLLQLDATKLALAVEHARHEFEQAQLEAANEADVTFALKALEVAKTEYERANESVQKFRDSVSKTEIERLRLEVARAEAGLEQAQHKRKVNEVGARIKATEIKQAEEELQRAQVRAPFDGLVLEVNHDAGEWVEPGETVIRLVRIDRLRAEGFLKLREVQQVQAGLPVVLSTNVPGDARREHRGRLTFVSPQAEPVGGLFRIKAEFENVDAALRPGLEGTMAIETP